MSEITSLRMHIQPLVSCIIIFYNAKIECFFEEAIASIFSQTYDHWELLLADDGSTDGSSEIARHYAAQYPDRVRYVEHPGHQNRGMSATRNLGIRYAKGDYIAFLDADDVWLPQKLEQQVPLLAAHPEVAMLYGRTQYWVSWSQHNPCIGTLNPDEPGDFLTLTSLQFDAVVPPPTQALLFLQNPHLYPCTCSILIRRRVFEEIGGFEEDFRNAHEDMVFHSKVFLHAPVYVSSQCWDRYRIHPNSYWRIVDQQGIGEDIRRAGRLKYLNWLEQYLSEQNIRIPEMRRLLKRELQPYRYGRLIRWSERFRHPIRSLRNLFRKVENQFQLHS